MRVLPSLGCLWLTVLVGAQESASPFDAPSLVFDDTTQILNLLDLDGDGDRDAIGFWGIRADLTRVHAFVNDGTGAFSLGFEFDDPATAAQRQSWSMAVGRFDSDNRDDFVIRLGERFSVYRSTGATTPPQLLASWIEPGSSGLAMTTADFDRDGLTDIAAQIGPQLVRIYMRARLGFGVGGSLPVACDDLDPLDVDGDGDLDLVAGRVGEVGFLLQQPGGWSVGPIVQHGIARGTDAVFTVTGDVDGDGDGDIVAFGSWGRYAILRCSPGGTFALEAQRDGGPATGLADLDGDGDLDGICCGSGGGGPTLYYNRTPALFHLAENRGGGDFAAAWELPSFGAVRIAGADDLDGDGDVDLVAGRVVWFSRGDTFTRDPLPRTSMSAGPIWWRVHDFDADGDTDVTLIESNGQTYRLTNDGSGAFRWSQPARPTAPGNGEWAPQGTFGDFDGDGILDEVVSYLVGGSFVEMRLLRGLGNGDRVDAGPAGAAGWAASNYPSWGIDAFVADLDADGDLDLLDAIGNTGLNDGTGYFTAGPGSALGGRAVAVGDLDGDGTPDLIVLRNARLEIMYGHNGLFGGYLQSQVFSCGSDQGRGVVRIADLDGDGDLDFVNNATYAEVYLNGGPRNWQQVPLSLVPAIWLAMLEVDDLDGDGVLDIVRGPVADGPSLMVHRGLGNGTFAAGVRQLADAATFPMDADGDGDLDIVGQRLVRNALHGASGGARVQYGQGGAGAGGHVPLLGARGPFRVGAVVTTTVGGAPGGTVGAWLWGTARSDLANTPLPGIRHYAWPVVVGVTVPFAGTAGAAGEGRFEMSYTVPAAAFGVSFPQQFHLLDATRPSGIGYTNGLEITIGR
ncbi:MAG: VCBS repeat-containing protein [Planctomycetes bacterium]|nr:VCBS repeat-containing protein [Planctomycetota bacterium]